MPTGVFDAAEAERPVTRFGLPPAGVAPLAELIAARARFETWSQLVLDRL